MATNSLKILICDDSILARKQLANFLLSAGYDNVVEATDGNQAVEIYKVQHPDVVFLDIVMPKKDGIETTREIMEYDSNAYIVIASSVGTKSNIKTVLEMGAKDFIQKPLNAQQIQAVMSKVLKGGK